MKYLIFIFMLVSLPLWGQYDIEEATKEDEKSTKFNPFEIKQRLYVGGEVGLSFGPGSSYVLLAPLVGYDITKRFSAGLTTMYQLYRFSTGGGNGININTFGIGTFARLRPIDQLILQTEFDVFNTVDFVNGNSYSDRTNVPAFMTGIGYAGGGSDTYYQIILFYDFINNPNMPLPPVIFNRLHLKMGMVWHLN